MAEEKGLIALNHCNNIANTIITKLGGTGYKPSEWRGKVNLLGISSADKSAVLAGLTPEASGEEAGLIDIETISGLAEELNEKYTTIRGFKPSEMRGAISAMSPLEEKTASGSIAHYTDGAKNTPLTKCEVTLAPSVTGRNPANVSGSIVSFSDSAEVGLKACKVTIPASLDGVSSVNVERTGKNIANFSGNIIASAGGFTFSEVANGGISFSGASTGTWAYITQKIPLKIPSGTAITFSRDSAFNFQHYLQITFDDETTRNMIIPDNETSVSYTLAKNVTDVRVIMSQLTQGETYSGVVYFQLEIGAATAYEPYSGKTYAAALGRTVYGGEPDIVNGSGQDNYKKIALGELTWIKYGTNGDFYCQQITDLWYPSTGGTYRYGFGVSDEFEFIQGTPTDGQINAYFNTAHSGYRIFINKADYAESTSAEFKEYLQSINAHLVYKVNDATAEAFTFSRVPIVPKAGVNTMWSAGDISVDYYKDGYGYEEVKVYHQGANFIDDTLNGIEQGTISGSTGRDVAGTNRVRTAGYIRFPIDKIQANYTLTIPEGYKLAMRFYTEDKAFVTPPSWAQGFINQIPAAYVGQNVQFARFILAKTDDSDITPEDIANAGFILNYGSAADTYEPYTEPEEKTKDLGGIVYGGSYDFVAGETEVTYKRADLGALTWVKFPTAGYADLYYTDDLNEEIGATSGSQTHGLCYEFDVVTNNGHDGSDSSATPQPYNSIRFRASDGRIYLKVAGYTTAAEMKAGVAGVMLLYAIHEPEAIEGTPEAIRSYFGVNTLWNEENDTMVGYYADIDLSSNTQNALNMVNLNQEEIE